MVLLEIKQVEKTYRTKLGFQQCVALCGISCKVEEGEFTSNSSVSTPSATEATPSKVAVRSSRLRVTAIRPVRAS